MKGYDHSTYGEHIASIYDDLYENAFDKQGAADFLADVAGEGPALELGIGTGRVAIPLVRHGVEVHGVDMSQAMVDRLHAKEGGADVQVTIGDFSSFSLDRTFSLIYVVFNTLFSLNNQDDQARCFETVANHLDERGVFVVEAFVPDTDRFDRGQRVEVDGLDLDHVWISASQHDKAEQQFKSHHIHLSEEGVKMFPVFGRYAYPSELDLMARLAGMNLRERWADWKRTPFTSDSQGHVSVYDKLPR